MHKYTIGYSPDSLEPWPFDNPASNYRILRGQPEASGRIDAGGSNASSRLGIWSCTEGTFECTEQGDELQTILAGRLTLTRDDGETIEAGPGDTIYTRKGERVTWDIHETVTKVFFTCLSFQDNCTRSAK